MKNKIFLVMSLLVSFSVLATWHSAEKVAKKVFFEDGKNYDISNWHNYRQLMEFRGLSGNGVRLLINNRYVVYDSEEAVKSISRADFEHLEQGGSLSVEILLTI